MSAISTELVATALSVLTEFGEAITVTRTTPGSYDTSTASTGAGSSVNYTGYGAPMDYTNRELDGEHIKAGDVRLFINAISVAPLPGDTVSLDSVSYRIVNVIKYTVTSVNVLYELQLRV